MSDEARLMLEALELRRQAWSRAEEAVPVVEKLAGASVDALRAGGQVVFFGNGGSASMAEHLAAELVGRYVSNERPPLASRSLTANSASVTAIGNDFGYETVFARQVQAVCRAGDVVVALSTSGRSPNVRAGLATAGERGCKTALFTGERGTEDPPPADFLVAAPASVTSAIQELHLFYGHLLCELIEAAFLPR